MIQLASSASPLTTRKQTLGCGWMKIGLCSDEEGELTFVQMGREDPHPGGGGWEGGNGGKLDPRRQVTDCRLVRK